MRHEAQTGYVVYFWVDTTRKYNVYTNPKAPLPLEMATSLAEHLRRSKTNSMVVAMPSGEIVAEVLA